MMKGGTPKNPKIFWGEMKDFIQRGSGDSRYLKTSLPPETSWAQALALLREGKFPMDLAGMNPAGWLQLGTLLSKSNLLRDETAQLLGLTPDAVPDDAFRAIKGLIEQSAEEAERLAAFSAATIDAVAKKAISAGDIVDIDGNYADKDLKFSTENSTVQKDMSLGTMLSNTRAVRIESASQRKVQLQQIGATTVSNGASFTLSIPGSESSLDVYRIFPIDSTSFLAYEGYYYSGDEEDSGGYGSPRAFVYAYLSGSTLYSFSSAFNSYGSYFVNGAYLPIPGKKALYAIDTEDGRISKLAVDTSNSSVTHVSKYPYWRLYDNPQIFFLCVLPDETLVICSESERSTNPNYRAIRILDPNTNTSAGGPRGSAKIVSSSADLRPNSSLQNKSWMTSIAVSTTTFLTVFADYYAVFTTRSGTTLTNGEPFQLFDETVDNTSDISLQHFSDTQALLVTKDVYGVVRYRLIGQDKSISEPTVVQPPNPSDGNPYTSWNLASGYNNIFMSLTQKENSAYKYSLTKLRERNYSKDAIAMTAASAGKNVKVCMGGNMALSSARRGQLIQSANGETVAYSYADGVINVIPLWNRVTRDVPKGMIMLWSGSIVDIPNGWALCDGQKGTPDLRDKFVLGAGGGKNPGANSAGSTGQIRTDTEGIARSVIGGLGSRQFVTAVYAEADSVPYYALAYIMKL